MGMGSEKLHVAFIIVSAIKMTSHPPPYEKFQNPDEPGAGQAPTGYPGYPGAPITLNQTVNAAPPGQHTVVVTQPAVSNVSALDLFE